VLVVRHIQGPEGQLGFSLHVPVCAIACTEMHTGNQSEIFTLRNQNNECYRGCTKPIQFLNRHDADALVAAYGKGDIYRTPRAEHDLSGQAIGDFAKSVWTAFPDASLEVISIGDTGGGLVAIQWMLHGTHTGPLMDGTPPTGRTVAYPGASFVQVEGDKIRYERIYTDRQTVS
jgi:steroid delta-isomerase-like uncharacterized protein